MLINSLHLQVTVYQQRCTDSEAHGLQVLEKAWSAHPWLGVSELQWHECICGEWTASQPNLHPLPNLTPRHMPLRVSCTARCQPDITVDCQVCCSRC